MVKDQNRKNTSKRIMVILMEEKKIEVAFLMIEVICHEIYRRRSFLRFFVTPKISFYLARLGSDDVYSAMQSTVGHSNGQRGSKKL